MKTDKDFPNGFESWTETAFEVNDYITTERLKDELTGEIAETQE